MRPTIALVALWTFAGALSAAAQTAAVGPGMQAVTTAQRLPDIDNDIAKNDEACSKLAVALIMKISAPDIPEWTVLCGQHPNGNVCEETKNVIQRSGNGIKMACHGIKIEKFTPSK